MNLLLVTKTEKLAEKLSALSPELEYCAAVVDNVKVAKEIFANAGLSQVPLYPMKKLQKYVETLEYDYVLLLQGKFYGMGIIRKLQSFGLPTEKLVSFARLYDAGNWQTERLLRHHAAHLQDFKIFATGTSPTAAAIDIRSFNFKTINFATSSQDLYYNFQIAKTVIECGENNSIRYALIGLAPYSFHFDLSKTYLFKCRVLPYLIAFNDIHNLPVPFDVYKSLLREKWLKRKPSIAKVNLNALKSQKVMEQKEITDGKTNTWEGKYYPATRDANIKILDDYLTLCEENNVRPIMFRVINSEKYMANFNPQLLDEFNILVEQACRKHPSACFIDGWKLEGFTYDDFYDHGHMNVHGAAKFSVYLNDFIEQLESKDGEAQSNIIS